MKPFCIRKRRIGVGWPCYIIAEAGVNHNGNSDMACGLIDAAEKAGADAVKFQTFKTEKLVARGTKMADYQIANMSSNNDQFDLLQQLEIGEKGFRKIFRHAAKIGIEVFSTPDEESSADLLERLGVPVFKIGSAEVTNLPFLKYLATKKKPIILSSGMSRLSEVALALETLWDAGADQIALLHCVSAYPASLDSLNLKVIPMLASCFGIPVGFSDHTLGDEASLAATALGASIIEKHLTLDKSLPGPDHICSLDPFEFETMVRRIRNVERALGDGYKEPAGEELSTREVVRKGLVADRDLKSGAVLARTDIAVKRVGEKAVVPADLEKVIGLTLTKSISSDTPISWEMFKTVDFPADSLEKRKK